MVKFPHKEKNWQAARVAKESYKKVNLLARFSLQEHVFGIFFFFFFFLANLCINYAIPGVVPFQKFFPYKKNNLKNATAHAILTFKKI